MLDHKKFRPILDKFVQFTSDKLSIDKCPIVVFQKDDTIKSFGSYNPSTNEITVTTKDRHPMDIFRTVAHELIHHRQNLDGRIKDVSKEGSTGSDIENEANSEAGKIMRWFAQANSEHFALSSVMEETKPQFYNKTKPIDKGMRAKKTLKQIRECEIDPAKREFGTNSLADLYKRMTPGQSKPVKKIIKKAKPFEKLRESLDGGVNDVSMVPSNGKEDAEIREEGTKKIKLKSKWKSVNR